MSEVAEVPRTGHYHNTRIAIKYLNCHLAVAVKLPAKKVKKYLIHFENVSSEYQMACIWSLLKKEDESIYWTEKAGELERQMHKEILEMDPEYGQFSFGGFKKVEA